MRRAEWLREFRVLSLTLAWGAGMDANAMGMAEKPPATPLFSELQLRNSLFEGIADQFRKPIEPELLLNVIFVDVHGIR